jgi:hypothetical protein
MRVAHRADGQQCRGEKGMRHSDSGPGAFSTQRGTVVNGVRRVAGAYLSRHANRWNRALHLIGVPLAPFLGTYFLVRGRRPVGAWLLVGGYVLQWLGHRAEGNELGEWTAMKKLTARALTRRRP